MEKFLSERVKSMQESATLKISGKAKKLKSEGKDVLALSAGEPDFPTPKEICDYAIESIQEGFTGYTAVSGIAELKEAIINKLRRDNQLDYKPEQIIVSNGCKQNLANLLLVLCQENDEVLIPAPYWVSYPEMVRLSGGNPVIIETQMENDFKMTPEQLERSITDKTKVLILNSPSNPTGSVYSEFEVRELMKVIEDKDIFVISDEIYEHLIYDGNHFSPAQVENMKDKVIVCNGVSKAYSMTGWRIGYSAGPEWITKACNKIQSQTTSNPCSISQKAATRALNMDQKIVGVMRDEFKKRREYMYEALNSIPGVSSFMPKGAFYIFPSIKGVIGKTLGGTKINDSMDFANYMLDEHLLAVVPGTAFAAPENIRLSYAASIEDLEKAVSRIKKAVS